MSEDSKDPDTAMAFPEDEPSFDEIVIKALHTAKVAFRKQIEDYGYDSSRCDIRFTVWPVDSNYEKRLRRFEIEEECKEEK